MNEAYSGADRSKNKEQLIELAEDVHTSAVPPQLERFSPRGLPKHHSGVASRSRARSRSPQSGGVRTFVRGRLGCSDLTDTKKEDANG